VLEGLLGASKGLLLGLETEGAGVEKRLSRLLPPGTKLLEDPPGPWLECLDAKGFLLLSGTAEPIGWLRGSKLDFTGAVPIPAIIGFMPVIIGFIPIIPVM